MTSIQRRRIDVDATTSRRRHYTSLRRHLPAWNLAPFGPPIFQTLAPTQYSKPYYAYGTI